MTWGKVGKMTGRSFLLELSPSEGARRDDSNAKASEAHLSMHQHLLGAPISLHLRQLNDHAGDYECLTED